MSDNKQSASLAEWLKPQCARLMYGRCTTLYCLKRGGYTGEPADAGIATCEPYELFTLLPRVSDQKKLAEIMERRAKAANLEARRGYNHPLERPTWSDIDYLLSCLEQPQSERCGECVRCHHSEGVDVNGWCLHGRPYIANQPDSNQRSICGHKCVFPATDSTSEQGYVPCPNPDCIEGKVSVGCAIDKPLISVDCVQCKGSGRIPATTENEGWE